MVRAVGLIEPSPPIGVSEVSSTTRHLRAIFHLRTGDSADEQKHAVAILRVALRALRVRDRAAELHVTPDDPPSAHYDADGD
ncbi:MAG: hypothetical protein ACRDRD_21430 [Pseudonocardiaceae bacterium]